MRGKLATKSTIIHRFFDEINVYYLNSVYDFDDFGQTSKLETTEFCIYDIKHIPRARMRERKREK